MKAGNFIQTTVKSLAAFFQEEFVRRQVSPRIIIREELADDEQAIVEDVAARNSFFNMRRPSQSHTLFLLPYQTRRESSQRNRARTIRNVQRDGRTIAIATAGAEKYLISCAVYGPSPISAAGQQLTASFVSLFLDHARVECLVDDSHEIIRISECTNQNEELAHFSRHFPLRHPPLILFTAEVDIETGTILSEDTRVESRVIRTESIEA